MNSRLDRLRSALTTAKIPAILVSERDDVRWLTGFSGSFGAALITDSEAVFVTDSRYTIQAAEEVTAMDVTTFATPVRLEEALVARIEAFGVQRMAFQSGVDYATYSRWKETLPAELIDAPDVFSQLRMIKDADEVEAIRKACSLADAALEQIEGLLQVGRTELDILLDLEFYVRRNGAGVAFDTIVVSGERSARPHGKPSDKPLESGDFVTIDFGARIDGYNSDMTRTFVAGEPTDRHREIYDAVLQAQQNAVAALIPGADGRDIDAQARQDLGDLAQYFGHGLGHGLGIQVHDPGRLSSTVSQPIEVGQVWTVEPGVYIEGFGGVRIEDDVLVTDDGPEILTHFPLELRSVG